MDQVERLIDAKAGAQLVGVAERTLRAWLATDPAPFPVFRHGKRCVRFKLSDLLRWIDTKMQADARGRRGGRQQ